MIKKMVKYFYSEQDSKEPLDSCLEQLFDYLSFKEFTLRNILFVNIFFKSDDDNYNKIRHIEKQLLKYRLDVPTAKIPQSPEHFEYVFEVWFISGDYHTVNFGDNFKIITRNDVFIMYLSVFNCLRQDKNYFEKTFEEVKKILDKNRFPVDSIFRQWGYIGNILQIRDGVQNYQKYNDFRAELYNNGRWNKGYPCATGIGIKSDSLNISVIAKRGHLSYDEYNLTNPLQSDPVDYKEEVLVGSYKDKKPPLFERGKIICTDDNIDFYISGTSSIRGQDNVDDNDVILQTKVTLENIKKLLDKEVIEKKIKGKYFDKIKKIDLMKSFSYLRVYLRDLQDINSIKPFILEEFGAVPTIYLEADLCREGLTVEIEGAIFV